MWPPNELFIEQFETLLVSLGFLCVAALAGLLLNRFLFFVFLRLAHRAVTPLSALLVNQARRPFQLLLPLLASLLVLPSLTLPSQVIDLLKHLGSLGIIGCLTWLCITLALLGQDWVLSRFNLMAQDNLKARTVHTQLTVLVKIILAAVTVLSGAAMLMTFDRIRSVGVSIFASAGMIGIILGFAAQRSLATLFAGLQIAFTQPIRLDDVVIVEGEWGRVEEITLTYVVVKLWDLRCLVIPITYFLEKPFQNWTRASANLLGTVFLYLDYAVPVDEVRQAFAGVLQASARWDGKVSGVQVTNCSERTVELRFLMSAADAPTAFDLRCEVREGLLAYLRKHHPGSLPKARLELHGGA